VTSITLSGLQAGQTYQDEVVASAPCYVGATVTSSFVSGTIIPGTVYLATQAGALTGTPVYGALVSVTVGSTSFAMVTGTSGAYSLAVYGVTVSTVSLCAEAPGFQSAAGAASGQDATSTCVSVNLNPGHSVATTNLGLSLYFTYAKERYSEWACPGGYFVSPTPPSCAKLNGVWIVNPSVSLVSQISTVTSSVSWTPTPSGLPTLSSGWPDVVSFSGTDSGASRGSGYVLWQIATLSYYPGFTGLPLSSPMSLSYDIYSANTWDCLHAAVNLVFTDGTQLFLIKDNAGNWLQDGQGNFIDPQTQCVPHGGPDYVGTQSVGTLPSLGWVHETVDLSEVTGKTVSSVEVGFWSTGVGSFQIYFDNIRLEMPQEQKTVVNGGFEENGLSGWYASGNSPPVVEKSVVFAGSYAAQVGASTAGLTALTSVLSQVIRIPSLTGPTHLCGEWYLASGDPTPSNAWQRVWIQDRMTGISYYLLGTPTSAAQNSRVWMGGCIDVTALQGDRVWLELEVSQALDSYATWAYFDNFALLPNNEGGGNEYTVTAGCGCGFGGASVPSFTAGYIHLPSTSFPSPTPAGQSSTYYVPFSGASTATSSDPGSYLNSLTTSLALSTFDTGKGQGATELLSFSATATANAGIGQPNAGPSWLCLDPGAGNTCYFVNYLWLGVAYICQNNAAICTADTGDGIYTNNQAQYTWNLGTYVAPPGPLDPVKLALDGASIVLGVAGLITPVGWAVEGAVAAATIIGAAGLGISIAQLGYDLIPPPATSGSSNCGGGYPSYNGNPTYNCPYWQWGNPEASYDMGLGGPTQSSATSFEQLQISPGGGIYWITVLAQAQIGSDFCTPNPGGGICTNSIVGTLNEIYVLEIDTN
jgi:hypothetical protein